MVAAGGARTGGGDAGMAAARLAWTALGGSLLLVAVGIGLRELGPRAGAYPFWGEVTVIVVVLGTLGALVAARRPGHPVGWLFAGIGLAGSVQLAETALEPGRPELLLGYQSPIGVAGAPWLQGPVGVMAQLFYLAELAAIGSLVVRFWQARGVERQQLKWFVYTAVVALVVLVLTNVFLYDLMEHGPLGSILWGGAPVALAVAVAVAASTLAVAALFQPARRRVQATVDRRFDRARYDAAGTVEQFGGRLRDQVDLDTLSSELLAVVDRTVQPASSSLLLRPVARARPTTGPRP
jgi:hypothetical protein